MSRSYKKLKRHLGRHSRCVDPARLNPYNGKFTGAGLKYGELRHIQGYRQMLRVKSAAREDAKEFRISGRAREVPIQVWYDLWVEGRIKTAWR